MDTFTMLGAGLKKKAKTLKKKTDTKTDTKEKPTKKKVVKKGGDYDDYDDYDGGCRECEGGTKKATKKKPTKKKVAKKEPKNEGGESYWDKFEIGGAKKTKKKVEKKETKKSSKKTTNPWFEHVRKYAKSHGINYPNAVKDPKCKASYKKSK